MDDNTYQVVPRPGRLAENLNLPHKTLLERIAPFRQATVYSYVVATVEYRDGRLFQTGSGPNFQGDLVTLCSCKHLMRTYRDPEHWEGVWIAGFTSYTHLGKNKLFYLMMVSQAFESHSEFWSSNSIAEEAKIAKAAHLDRFGDIYQPKDKSGDPYLHECYLEPCEKHVHCESRNWHKDISYPDRFGRRPALLVGNPEYSFLWDEPLISSPFKLPRAPKKTTLADLLPCD